MKKIKKIGVILLILLMFYSIALNCSYATEGLGMLQSFNGKPTGGTVTGGTKVATLVGSILEVVRLAGAGIAVVMLLVLGIKYTIASASDRADIKKSATTYVTGALIMFGASGILGIVQAIINESLAGTTK